MKYKQPTKALILAAGLGTRFLPYTKATPKEMLPIIDKPVIQLIVEEAVAAGVGDIIIIGGTTKRSIEDHFSRSYGLEHELKEIGKNDKADQIAAISNLANFTYIDQKGLPKGNARPVLNASHLLSPDEPFFVFFADDFFHSDVPRAKQLLSAYNKTGKSVISLKRLEDGDEDKYGVAEFSGDLGDGTLRIKTLIEKPGKGTVKNIGGVSIGGYLLTHDILPIIAQERIDKNGEIVLADSINELAQQSAVYGQVIDGIWHDTGDQLKYVQAVVDMALAHEKYGSPLKKWLKNKIK